MRNSRASRGQRHECKEAGFLHKQPRRWKINASRRCEMQRNYLPLRIISRAPKEPRRDRKKRRSAILIASLQLERLGGSVSSPGVENLARSLGEESGRFDWTNILLGPSERADRISLWQVCPVEQKMYHDSISLDRAEFCSVD